MVRYRKIRKWGNSFAIMLLKSDVQDLNVKEGDYLDLEDCVVVSKELYQTKFGENKNDKRIKS